jgi:purine-binding chemotaxis protein CheW
MCNLQWKTMVNLQPQSTTERQAPDLLDEEDERERVLLVVVRGPNGAEGAGTRAAETKSDSADDGTRGSETKNDTDGLISYAMPVSSVREVIRARAVTRVPGSPRVMSGLVNVRGMVVTVLDLAACLYENGEIASVVRQEVYAEGVTQARTQKVGSIVLLEHGGRLIGLAVHGVRDVRPLDDAGLVSEHSVLAEGDGFKRGLASAGGEVVTLLDVAALLSRHLISSGET